MADDVDAAGWQTHSAHWGAFSARWQDDVLAVRPYPTDPDPTPILDNLTTALRHMARIARPMVRRGWLDMAPGRMTGAGATRSSRCPGTARWTCWRPSWHGCATHTARARSSAAPMAGPAPGASITRRASCTGS